MIYIMKGNKHNVVCTTQRKKGCGLVSWNKGGCFHPTLQSLPLTILEHWAILVNTWDEWQYWFMVYTPVQNSIAEITLKFTSAYGPGMTRTRNKYLEDVPWYVTYKHGLGRPWNNLRVPYKCCNAESECLCNAMSLLLWGYKSQVMVESSHP